MITSSMKMRTYPFNPSDQSTSMMAFNFRKVSFPTLEGKIIIRPQDIAYFKSDDIYCYLHETNGQIHFVSKALKWVEARLSSHAFLRIHRSHYINIENIIGYKKEDGGYLKMENGQYVPIARSKRHLIHELIA